MLILQSYESRFGQFFAQNACTAIGDCTFPPGYARHWHMLPLRGVKAHLSLVTYDLPLTTNHSLLTTSYFRAATFVKVFGNGLQVAQSPVDFVGHGVAVDSPVGGLQRVGEIGLVNHLRDFLGGV